MSNLKCRTCGEEIEIGILCNQCYVERKLALGAELEGKKLGLLDHHGAIVDPLSLQITEMDTGEEFSGIVIKKKVEFGGRATAPNCGNLDRLKDCSETIKMHLLDSFTGWLKLGYPMATDDPMLLSVRVLNANGKVVSNATESFSFEGLFQPQSMVLRLNESLWNLPHLMNKVGPSLRNYRTVEVHLLWWATMSQQKHQDFLNELKERTLKSKAIETGKELLELHALQAKAETRH